LFFHECNIRFFTTISSDHVHDIAIHNSSAQPIDILLREDYLPADALVDLSFAPVDRAGEVSFLQTLRSSTSARPSLDGLNRFLTVLDLHYRSPSLLTANEALTNPGQWDRDSSPRARANTHIDRLTVCEKQPSQPGCREEA